MVTNSPKQKTQAIIFGSVVKLEISDKIEARSNLNYSWNEDKNKENYKVNQGQWELYRKQNVEYSQKILEEKNKVINMFPRESCQAQRAYMQIV